MDKIDIKELTKERIDALFTEYVLHIKQAAVLEQKCEMFVGLNVENVIFMREKAFDKVVEILQPVVTYDPNWGNTDITANSMEAYFFYEIAGEKYKVFCLKDKEVRHV